MTLMMNLAMSLITHVIKFVPTGSTLGAYIYDAKLFNLRSAASNANGLSVCHLNVRSSLPKMEQIRYIVRKTEIDVWIKF